MNKEHFLIELKIYLRPLPITQQEAILKKYEAIFDERIAAGESETEIAKSLDKPKIIAEYVLQELEIHVPEKQLSSDGWTEFTPSQEEYDSYYSNLDSSTMAEKKQVSPLIRLFQIGFVLALNFFLMIWVIFAFAGVLFSLWISAIALIATPFLYTVSAILGFSIIATFPIFLGILLFGIGIIGLVILRPLSSGFLKLVQYYFQWNMSILKGGA